MPTEKAPGIRDIADLTSARIACLNAIWGVDGWPVLNRAKAMDKFIAVNKVHAAELKRRGIPTEGAISGKFVSAEELWVKVDIAGHSHETLAYHLRPSVRPVDRLVIVHHGHDDDFISGGYRLHETLAHFLGAGHSVLAMYMPNYGPAPRTPATVPLDGDRHGPIFAQAGLATSTAFRVFLEPVTACLNYLCDAYEYFDFHMIGLSGGGWSTVLCAAVDSRIRVSISVSGSLPLDLRFFGSLGDEEQMQPTLFHDTIGYRDLYTLAAYGYGRRHLQVLYERDACFSDAQWPSDAPTSLEAELEKYESDISARLASGLSGSFQIARLNDNGGAHLVSPQAIGRSASVIESVTPRACPLFFYAKTGLAARSIIQSNGRYQFVGETSGLKPGWTDVVATHDNQLLFYEVDDGSACTARLGSDGALSTMREISGVGSGWTNVTAVGARYVFLYNSALGTARIGRIEPAGDYVHAGPVMAEFSTNWTHAAGAPHGGLFLFDAEAGVALMGRVDSEGYVRCGEIKDLPTGCTAVTAVNNNALFFYNARTGKGTTAIFDPFGRFVDVGSVPDGVPLGATHVIGAGNGGLFFLMSSDATGAVWLVDELGEARAIQRLEGFGPWTDVTTG